MRLIESYLKDRLGSADPAVMAAFRAVPREYFHYQYDNRRATPGDAYEATPKPWALGFGSALSDYLGQAYMTQIAQPKPTDVTLEIGTGSGFQSALLSRIVKRAYSIEIIEPLGHAVGKIFAPLGYDNVHTRVGDGYFGWPEVSGGFDVVIVTCAARAVQADQARRADDHSDRPALQEGADPLRLHQGRGGEDPFPAGCRGVFHSHDRDDDEDAGAAEAA
jgi:protein-L-isoaspartate(D-aspartate) O-methyltransferase